MVDEGGCRSQTLYNMCGPEVTNRPRGGALAALSAPNGAKISGFLQGDLAFHTPGKPGSTEATHARLTPGEECGLVDLERLRVVIQYVPTLCKPWPIKEGQNL